MHLENIFSQVNTHTTIIIHIYICMDDKGIIVYLMLIRNDQWK